VGYDNSCPRYFIYFFYFIYLFFGSTEVWSQDFVLAGQVLYW
jgi:hypothetical protein